MPPRDPARRRILLVAWQGAPAGIERHLSTLIRALPARFEKTVAFLSRGGPVADEIAAAGVPVHVLGMRRSYDPIGGRRLLRLARKGGFALVHDHSTMAAAPILMLGLAGIPLVVTEHLSFAQRRLDQRLMYRLLSRFVGAFIANSTATREDLLLHGIPADRVHVVYHGMLPSRVTTREEARAALAERAGVTPPAAGDAPVIGFVGRLEPEKGCRQFVTVAARVAAAVPPARFVIVGDGSERAAVAGDVAAAGLSDRFQMTGTIADTEGIYPAFDVLVSTSKRETFGLAILEAMAAGVPVAAFAVGGVAELITAGAGELVEPGDIEGLADRVVGLLRNGVRRRALGEQARDRVAQRFSAVRMAEEVAALYDGVCAQR